MIHDDDWEARSQLEVERLVHDLRVHQAELEAQNAELRHAQQLLEESRARYCDLYDFAPIGFCTLDRDGNVLEINLAGAAMLGLTRQQIVGRYFPSVVGPESRARVRDHLARCNLGLPRVQTELSLRPGSGNHIVAQIVSTPDRQPAAHFRTIISDVTTQKRAHDVLRWIADVSARIGALHDAGEIARILPEILIPRLADTCAVWLLGADGTPRLAASSAPGRAFEEAELRLGCRAALRRTIEGGFSQVLGPVSSERWAGPACGLMVPIALAGGHRLGALQLVVLNGRKAYGPAELCWVEQLANLVAFALDHARVHAENAHALVIAEQERGRAEEANRAKDEFLAIVSHELRTPLTAILGWTRILRSGPQSADRTARALETIERNVHAQVRLVGDLLDMNRILAGKIRVEPIPTDMRAAVETAIESLRPTGDAKGVTLSLGFDDYLSPVNGEPDRVRQIASNLISNAIKFTPRGGHVDVELRERDDHVELCVRDDGVGIDAAFLPHLFDRFRQANSGTTRSHGGLGLGLAIVRHLVDAHHGEIHVESAGTGGGASFWVRLPKVSNERSSLLPSPAPEPETNLEPASLGGLRALVVEDDPDARDLIVSVLQGSGAQVTTASSAAEAFAKLPLVRPQVLVSDIGMPDEDGCSMLRRMRMLPPEAGGRTPALAITAYASPEDRARAELAGFAAYLTKPVDPRDLIAAVVQLSAA